MANNTNNNEEKRVPWSRSHFYCPQNCTSVADVVLDVTGFVQYINHRTANTANGERPVCDITINAYIGDSKVRRYFGDNFVREDHRVSFRMSYWGYSAENIQKMKVKEGDIVQAMLHSMELSEGTTDSGKFYRNVICKTSDDLDLISRSKKKESDNSGSNYPNQYGAAPQQPAQYNAPPQQAQQYNAPPQQAQQYNAPPQQAQQYNAPPQQAQQYNAPPQQAQQYNAPPQQAQQYNAPPQQAQQQYNARPQQAQQQYNAPPQQVQQQYNVPPQQGAQVTVCSACGNPIDAKVADYSMRKHGRHLCRNCQTNGQNAAPAQSAPQYQPQNQSFANVGGVDLFEELDGLDSSNPFYAS